jgi:hypothetical protein
MSQERSNTEGDFTINISTRFIHQEGIRPIDSHNYHAIYITTPDIPRMSIFYMRDRVVILWTREEGWEVWENIEAYKLREELPEKMLGGQYGYDFTSEEGKWLILEVSGYEICNSSDRGIYR